MLKTVTLLGSSSGRNAGDAALMAAIMDGVDEACGRKIVYEIPTIRPTYLRDHYPNHIRPIGMMPWHGALRMLGWPTLRSLLRTDAIIIFDAILFDRSLFNPLFNFLSSIYCLLPLAERRGIPIIGFNVGVGPIHTKAGRHMLKSVAERMRFITVRDRDSLDLLNEVGVNNPRVKLAADAALNAPSWDDARAREALVAAGLQPNEPLLGININRYLDTWASSDQASMGKERFLHVFAEALTRVYERLRVPLAFVTTQYHDVDITRALMDRLPREIPRGLIDNRHYDHAAIKGIVRQLSLLCGMRLHSLIMASAECTPVVGISYQPKVAYYFRELGLPDYTLSFEAFSVDTLSDHIVRGWDERDALTGVLRERIPPLQRKAAQSAWVLAALEQGDVAWEKAWTSPVFD